MKKRKVPRRNQKKFDLYAFVAGDAVKKPDPFPLHCNCGGIVTIMPPFQDKFVVCPQCELTIMMFVVEGDPGYIIGRDPVTNEPMLLPVQGSSEKALAITPEKRARILKQAKKESG